MNKNVTENECNSPISPLFHVINYLFTDTGASFVINHFTNLHVIPTNWAHSIVDMSFNVKNHITIVFTLLFYLE